MKICLYSILFIYLLAMSIYDVKRKEIHMGVTLLTGGVLAAIRIFQFIHKDVTFEQALGVVPGILVLLLSYFTHGKIEVSGIAVLHCQMVQYCFRQIGSHQFAGYEFHSEQRTFGK